MSASAENVAKACVQIEIFLKRLSKKNPAGSWRIVLRQSGLNGVELPHPVTTFQMDYLRTDIHKLARAIGNSASEDMRELVAERVKYTVRVDGLELRCTFTLKSDGVDSEEKNVDTTAVAGLTDFRKKYGSSHWAGPIEEFILKAPEFPGDGDLAEAIGVLVADLQFALRYP